MGRARQQMKAVAAVARRIDDFTTVLGAGRGLTPAQDAERREHDRLAARLAAQPRPIAGVEDDGSPMVSYYLNNDEEAGVLHREDGPAQVIQRVNGDYLELHYHEGQYHREDGPAFLLRAADGTSTAICYKHGVAHCANGPATTITGLGGHVTEVYLLDGVPRAPEDGPARIERRRGVVSCSEYQDAAGKPHRDGGPAYMTLTANGGRLEQWCQHGSLHRLDGPASVKTDVHGIRREQWYRDGERVSAPKRGRLKPR